MNQKSNKIAICFLAAAILAGTSYMFLNVVDDTKPVQDQTEKEPSLFIAMTREQIAEEGIKIQTAGPSELQINIPAHGKITYDTTQIIHITPKVSGIVRNARKSMGDSVSKGEILFVLDSQEIAEAKSSYLDKVKKERQAGANLEREQNLRYKNISSEQDLQNRQSEADQAFIELELAKQKLQIMGLTEREIEQLEHSKVALRQYELRSPMAGTVIDKSINIGQILHTDDEAYVIVDLSTVYADLNVSLQDLGLISDGQEVNVSCPYGSRCKGQVIWMSPLINSDTHTVSVFASIENPNKIWKPGSYVSAEIKTTPELAAIAIPKEAIQKIENKDCVFIFNDQGFKIQPVKKGRSDDKQVEIVSGLSLNEPYASTNTFILKAEHGKDEAQHMD